MDFANCDALQCTCCRRFTRNRRSGAPEVSRELLRDVTRWSSKGVDGGVEVVRTDATGGLDAGVWIDVLQSFA